MVRIKNQKLGILAALKQVLHADAYLEGQLQVHDASDVLLIVAYCSAVGTTAADGRGATL